MTPAALVALSLAMQAGAIVLSPTIGVAYDLLLMPLAVLVGLTGLARQPHGAPWVAFTLAVLALVQLGRRYGGDFEFMVLAGRIPSGDAKDYLADAVALLHGHALSPVTAKRPFFVLALAALLRATGLNLALAMAVLTALNGLALAGLVVLVRRLHGSWAAAVAFLLCYFYYRRFVAIPLTEHVGFALGCLGTALLLRAGAMRSLTYAWAGTLLMALALTARAGAMVLLALLPLWAGWLMAPRGRRAVLVAVLACAAGAALPLAVNRLLAETYGQAGAGFNNFSYTLYGLLHGGTWTQATIDHPHLTTLSEFDRTNAIMAMALDTLRAEPWRLATGAVRAWANALTPHKGLFSFIYGYPDAFSELVNDYLARGIRPALASVPGRLGDYHWFNLAFGLVWQAGGWLGLAAGLLTVCRTRRPDGVLLLATTGAILLSLPFAPPWDADFMRVYAATIPLLAVLTGVGAARLTRQPDKGAGAEWTADYRALWQPAVAITLLAAVSLPWARHSLNPEKPALSCPGGSQPVAYRVIGGTWATLATETEGTLTLSPARVQAGLRTLGLIGSPWEAPLRHAAGGTIGMIYRVDDHSAPVVQVDNAARNAAEHGGCLRESDGLLPRISLPPG